MPGIKDRDDKNASFITGGTKNRSAVAAADDDTSFAAAPSIDISASPSAAHNSIFIIPSRKTGTGTVSFELWRRLTRHNPAYTGWIKIDTAGTQETDSEIRFTDLVAAEYKIKVTALSVGAQWDIYESHSES